MSPRQRDHYDRAVELLELAENLERERAATSEVMRVLREAQVHATLATVEGA